MKNADLLVLWEQLAHDRRNGEQEVRRRIALDAAVDIFAFYPQRNTPGLLARAVLSKRLPVAEFNRCRGVSIRADAAEKDGQFSLSLVVILEDQNLLGIFSVLCSDLIETLVSGPNAEAAWVQAVARLSRWLVMFERMPADGLSRERRIGLFGEMHVLLLLMDMTSPDQAAAAWSGWDAKHQDFRLGGAGIEVKTSSAKQHARISIASEKQLDEEPWAVLMLAFVRIDVNVPAGLALPVIIDSVRSRLSDLPAARYEFDTRLLEYGYTDAQQDLYASETYAVREVEFFEVRDDFPRLTEREIPSGVGDVTYTIIASDLKKFELERDRVRKIIERENR